MITSRDFVTAHIIRKDVDESWSCKRSTRPERLTDCELVRPRGRRNARCGSLCLTQRKMGSFDVAFRRCTHSGLLCNCLLAGCGRPVRIQSTGALIYIYTSDRICRHLKVSFQNAIPRSFSARPGCSRRPAQQKSCGYGAK